jgi:O-antigen ligase
LILITVLVRWKIKTSEVNKKVIRAAWWFFGVALLSCVFSISPYLSFGFSFHVLFAVMLFWLLLDERIKIRKIIWFLSLGLIVPCLFGWWQVLIGRSPAVTVLGLSKHLAVVPGTAVVETAAGRLMRAYGSFPHPNIFGGWLAMVILMTLGRSVPERSIGSDRSQYATIVRAIILILFSLTLVTTFSRSAWLALGTGIVSIFIWHIICRIKVSKKFLFDLFVALVAVVVSAALFHSAITTRMSTDERLEIKSLSERQSEYQMIGEVIKINPFLGVGAGSYTVALAEKFPGREVWFYQPIHNVFLLFFTEIGLLGLLFLGHLFFVFWKTPSQSLNYFLPRHSSPRATTGRALLPLLPLLPLAALDHYLWSQWAGLSLVAVVLAVFLRKLDKIDKIFEGEV